MLCVPIHNIRRMLDTCDNLHVGKVRKILNIIDIYFVGPSSSTFCHEVETHCVNCTRPLCELHTFIRLLRLQAATGERWFDAAGEYRKTVPITGSLGLEKSALGRRDGQRSRIVLCFSCTVVLFDNNCPSTAVRIQWTIVLIVMLWCYTSSTAVREWSLLQSSAGGAV